MRLVLSNKMGVDVKKLVAAISPDVFCDNAIDVSTGKSPRQLVKEIVKSGKGYLEAAKVAKLVDSDYLDIPKIWFSGTPFDCAGLKDPIEQHKLIYDVFAQGLEPIYFWILEYVNNEFGGTEKLIDNFVASPGSGHFAEMSKRATVMQEEAMKMFGTANTVLRSILNVIYDLKEFKMLLAQYDDLKSSDPKLRGATMLSLKQRWLDLVDIKKGNTALKAMAFGGQSDFVTLLDAFMVANNLEDVKRLDLNDRVKRILEQRIPDFIRWIKESESELRKRFEIEKIYLKSQVNSIHLYARWIKPYLKAAKQLEQNASTDSSMVSQFNTSLFELVVLGLGKYDPIFDVKSGDLPEAIKRAKYRTVTPFTIMEINFRSVPERSDQRGGYTFRGRAEITFTSFALNSDEMKVLREEIAKDDFGDVFKFIEGATEGSLQQVQADLDELMEDDSAEKVSKEQDVNPFSSLFSGLKSSGSKKVDLSKGIPRDSDFERVIRSQAALQARFKCRKVYDQLKKAYNMPMFAPTLPGMPGGDV